ncbi:MAG: hypothetical protein EHM13_08240, partial [Acidobacteria bacterium]
MPRKRPPAKTKIQGHEAGQVLETQQVDAPPDEPTVGELLGQLPVPGQPRPNPAFATFADEQEQLADPTVLPDRPGAATPPSPPYFDPQQHPDPDQGWATSHPNEIDPALPGSTFEDVTWPLDAPVAQQVEDDYRPGDNEPPPGERPVEQDPETADQVTAALNKQRQSVYDAQRRRAGLPVKDTPKREKLGMPDAGLLGARLLNMDGGLQFAAVHPLPTPWNAAMDSDWLRHRWWNRKGRLSATASFEVEAV